MPEAVIRFPEGRYEGEVRQTILIFGHSLASGQIDLLMRSLCLGSYLNVFSAAFALSSRALSGAICLLSYCGRMEL